MLAIHSTDLPYQIALTMVPNIGAVQAKILAEHFESAAAIFQASQKELSSIENIGTVRAGNIKRFTDFSAAEAEIRFIEQYKIQPLFITTPDYPQRLLHCSDAPAMLYYRGNADLNAAKVISIIGTRACTHYGRQITEKLIADLSGTGILVVSGLALGVDAVAHKAALTHLTPTVGVLAHGLGTLYPHQHKSLAREMVEMGGLLTEFGRDVQPDKYNFPRRNRIVAGIADATVVIETAIKGGSMITAELAHGYNRDVFAFPGKTTDSRSEGCNHLIRQHKASLLTNAQQLLEMMGWEVPATLQTAASAPPILPALSPEEQMIVTICREKDCTHIDELYTKSNLPPSVVTAAILQLELTGILVVLPGKMHQLTAV